MLTPCDAELVERDRVLPGLATLLDPAAFATLLQEACPTHSIQGVETVYVRYKPATSCLVTYQVTAATLPCPTYVYALAFRQDEEAKLAKAYEKRYPNGLLGFGTRVCEQHRLVLYSFPIDRRLKALHRLYSAPKRHQLLAKLAPAQPALHRAELTTLRYKPERRLVARVDGAQQQALLRLYGKEEFAVAIANHVAIQPNSDFCTPQVLGSDGDHQVLLVTWLPGYPLDQLLGDEYETSCAVSAVGRGLASLHTQRTTLPTHYTPVAESAALQTAAHAVAALVPNLGERATRLAAHLGEALTVNPPAPVVIHGDFSADQVLVHDPRGVGTDQIYAPVALLDWDRAGHGDPAADLGSFAANLYQRVQRGQLTNAQCHTSMTALCQGYTSMAAQSVSPQRLHLHTAARLLRLATEPFRQRWATDWQSAITVILDQVEEISADV